MQDINILNYPLNAELILRKKRALKRQLMERQINWVDKKIAILCGSTANDVRDCMELFLLNEGIRPAFYLSEYNKYWEDAVFEGSELESFQPDLIYIHTTSRNLTSWPSVAGGNSVNAMLDEQFTHFKVMWDALAQKYGCPLIQNNFERPIYRLLGNSDIYDSRGRSSFVFHMNGLLYDYARTHKNFYIHDIDYQSAAYGLNRWHDERDWHLYKYALALKAIPDFAYSLTRIIKSLYGKNKKVLALDLDNTLWGGRRWRRRRGESADRA